ncbi:MAG TPA: ribosome recycling factor [Candidatus Saccharimonadales bacterium]|nr:ribosome recycling factor [Candidatus Saccharimonadales bacterium]
MESIPQLVKTATPRLDRAVAHLEEELRSLRTGRATTALVENLTVEQYGAQTPLKAVATITTPDARSIAISPWDKNLVAPIEKMLRENQSLGLNPSSDGNVVRLSVPPMTEERRHEIVKDLGTKVEQCNITLRQVRHDVLNEVKRREKDKQATKDDVKYAETELTKLIETYKKRIDGLAHAKEVEIMTV